MFFLVAEYNLFNIQYNLGHDKQFEIWMLRRTCAKIVSNAGSLLIDQPRQAKLGWEQHCTRTDVSPPP